MLINIEINNKAKSPIKDTFFSAVARKTLAEIKLAFLENKEISVSVAIVSEKEIQKLNKKWRKIDQSTDVLSFPEYPSLKEIKKQNETELFLGEIILCYDDIKKYALSEKLELKKELAKAFAHSILHLLGFQHGKTMFACQEKIAKNF